MLAPRERPGVAVQTRGIVRSRTARFGSPTGSGTLRMRLTRPVVLLLALAILAVALIILNAAARRAGSSSSYARSFPFQLEDVVSARITPNLPFFVADVDRDGNEDLLINGKNRLLWYRLHENKMNLAGEAAYERPGVTRMVGDANGDGRPDFFVFMDTPEGRMLSCHDWFSPDGPSVPLYEAGPLFPPHGEVGRPWNRTSFFGTFTPPKGDHPVFLVGLNRLRTEGTGRSILEYDGVTGRELWRFNFAPHALELACDDFGTGAARVVFTTVAVGNGKESNGTTDSTCYILCLDQRNGHSLWKKDLGGFGARAYLALADINADGRKEILVARSLPPGDSIYVKETSPWIVAAVNGEGAFLAAVPLPIRPASIAAVNLEGDSAPEVVVDGTDGRVAILGNDLTIMTIIKPPAPTTYIQFRMFGMWDLEGRGKPVLVARMDSMLMVQDRVGTLIAERKIRTPIDVKLARYDGRNHIVAASGDSIHVMTMQRLPLTTRFLAYSPHLTIWAAAAALIAVWAAFQVRLLLKWRRDRQLSFEEEQNELLTAMSAFGHGGSSLKVLDRLRLHLKNWERIRSEGVTREELFARLGRTYGETVVPELRHIVMLAHKARVPEASWGTLLAEAKLAGEEMEAIIASGPEETARRNEHIAKALAALDAVDESIAGIRSHMRSVFRAPVAETLGRLIERFRQEHDAKGISFSLVSDSSAADAVFISPVSFDKIFEALLSNAVRATGGKTLAEVSIAFQSEGNYCRIDVRDNGCGIARGDWERVFERHYTTKAEGGGFGLHYAREELAKFGGKIHVLDSLADSGTTMRVVLRKSEKSGAA
jgi:signal transduction histidine kinase